MSQLVNPVLFRLRRVNYWNNIYSINSLDFKAFNIEDANIHEVMTWLIIYWRLELKDYYPVSVRIVRFFNKVDIYLILKVMNVREENQFAKKERKRWRKRRKSKRNSRRPPIDKYSQNKLNKRGGKFDHLRHNSYKAGSYIKNKKYLSRNRLKIKAAVSRRIPKHSQKEDKEETWVHYKAFMKKLKRKIGLRTTSITNKNLVKRLNKKFSAFYFLSNKLKKWNRTSIIAKNFLKLRLWRWLKMIGARYTYSKVNSTKLTIKKFIYRDLFQLFTFKLADIFFKPIINQYKNFCSHYYPTWSYFHKIRQNYILNLLNIINYIKVYNNSSLKYINFFKNINRFIFQSKHIWHSNKKILGSKGLLKIITKKLNRAINSINKPQRLNYLLKTKLKEDSYLKGTTKDNIKFLEKLNIRAFRSVKFGRFIFRGAIFLKIRRRFKYTIKRAIVRKKFFSFSSFYYKKLSKGSRDSGLAPNPLINIFYNLNIRFRGRISGPRFLNSKAKMFYINYLLKIIKFVNSSSREDRSISFNYFGNSNLSKRPLLFNKKVYRLGFYKRKNLKKTGPYKDLLKRKAYQSPQYYKPLYKRLRPFFKNIYKRGTRPLSIQREHDYIIKSITSRSKAWYRFYFNFHKKKKERRRGRQVRTRKMFRSKYFKYLLRRSFKLFIKYRNFFNSFKTYNKTEKLNRINFNIIKYFSRFVSIRKKLFSKMFRSGLSYYLIRRGRLKRRYRKKRYLINRIRLYNYWNAKRSLSFIKIGDPFYKFRSFLKIYLKNRKRGSFSPISVFKPTFKNKLFLAGVRHPIFYLEFLKYKSGVPLVKTNFYLHLANYRIKNFFTLFYPIKRKRSVEFKKYLSSSFYFKNIFNKFLINRFKELKLTHIFFKSKCSLRKRKKIKGVMRIIKKKTNIFPSRVFKLNTYLNSINNNIMRSDYFLDFKSNFFKKANLNKSISLMRVINTSVRKYFRTIYSRKIVYIYRLKLLFYNYFYKFLNYTQAPNFFIVFGTPGRGGISARFIVDMVLTKLEQKYKIGVILWAFLKATHHYKAYFNINGLKVIAAGRFARRDRSVYKIHKKGSLPLSSKYSLIDYSIGLIPLRYSVCVCKVWLSFGN